MLDLIGLEQDLPFITLTKMALALPTFFSWDNFSTYPDGPLPSPNGSLAWALSGHATYYYNFAQAPRDNFKSYADGPLPSPNAGFDWSSSGTTTHYSN
jgi:hypothetical protein